jgi:hypothetical protein
MPRPLSLWLLLFSLSLLGIGGLYGGIIMLADPTGRLIQLNEVRPLLHVPNFILPGMFLIVAMGLVPLGLVHALFVRPKWVWAQALVRQTGLYWAWTGAVAIGVVLLCWLAIQGLLIGFRWPIQYVTAVIGISVVALALTPPVRKFYKGPDRTR